MSRDIHKQRVYDAEDLVFAETLFAEPMGGAVVELHQSILASPWWRSEVGIEVRLEPARREAGHSYARGSRLVRLALHGENAWTLTHELAHSAHTGTNRTPLQQAHGPEFRRWYVDLAVVVLGEAASERLARSFIEAGLPIGERTCAAPVAPGEFGLYGWWRAMQAVSA